MINIINLNKLEKQEPSYENVVEGSKRNTQRISSVSLRNSFTLCNGRNLKT